MYVYVKEGNRECMCVKETREGILKIYLFRVNEFLSKIFLEYKCADS